MSEKMRFAASMPIIQLENLYRKKYRGHEADVLFQPTLENMLRFQIDIQVPHMVTVDESLKREFEGVMNRAFREMLYSCGEVASRHAERNQANA
jgi:hypothetical protein